MKIKKGCGFVANQWKRLDIQLGPRSRTINVKAIVHAVYEVHEMVSSRIFIEFCKLVQLWVKNEVKKKIKKKEGEERS